MEEQLECANPLSLSQMAQRGVIARMFCDSGILPPISIFQPNTHKIARTEKDFRENIEPKIKNNVLALNLPESFTEQMIEMARQIGLQIKRWKDRQDYHFRNETEEIILHRLSSKLHWTMAGLIDYHKTAKDLVRCDTLDVVLRYKLACFNCLEDVIPRLWEKLPEETKVHFYSIVCDQKPPLPSLHFCWPHFLQGELKNLDYLWRGKNLTSFYQWAFEESAAKCNKIATKYFFQKLRPGERGVSLKKSAIAVYDRMSECVTCSDELFDVFFYLLSVMTLEERVGMFNHTMMILVYQRPLNVLCFLDWPWPDLFLENMCNFWKIMPPSCYGGLYMEMFYKLEKSDPSLSRLFPELFKQSPPDFKKQFLHLELRFGSFCFMHLFLRSDNLEGIRAIFRNVDVPDRVRLLFTDFFVSTFRKSILAGKWDAVEVCLREATLPEDRWKRMKEIFRRTNAYRDESKKLKFEKFFRHIESSDEEKMAKKHKLKDCYVRIKRLRPLPGDGESVSLVDLGKNPVLS